MPCSAAQLAANRANAMKSTGPKSDEGKERSRANAYKHGLTGAGVVLSSEDAEALDRRLDALMGDLKPADERARLLIHRAALHSIRMDRLARQEAGATNARVAKARAELSRDRRAEAEQLLRLIAAEPAATVRRLRATPEGVDVMVDEWTKLKADLDHEEGTRWTRVHSYRADYLHGSDSGMVGASYYEAWTRAYEGKYDLLRPDHFQDCKTEADRKQLALQKLGDLVDADLEQIKEDRASMDTLGGDAEMEYAEDVALFDPSKEGELARKYEAAAERGFYRALKELKELRREALAEARAAEPSRAPMSLASFLPASPPPRPTPPRPSSGVNLPSNEVAITAGRGENRRE